MSEKESDENLIEDAEAVDFVPAGIGTGLRPEAGGDDHVLFRFLQDLVAVFIEGVIPDLLGWYNGCTKVQKVSGKMIRQSAEMKFSARLSPAMDVFKADCVTR